MKLQPQEKPGTSDGAGVGASENKGWRGAATETASQLWKTRPREPRAVVLELLNKWSLVRCTGALRLGGT